MSEAQEDIFEAQAGEPAPPLPGVVLRGAREAMGYSLAEVSQALKFSVRQLEALENDDYSSLKGATFIRGFVRSYARYLKIDEVPLLASLEPQAPVAVAEVHPVESMDAEMPASGGDGSKRFYLLAAVVLLLGGVAWFVWQGKIPQKGAEKLAASASASVVAPQTKPRQVEPVAVADPTPAKVPDVSPAPVASPSTVDAPAPPVAVTAEPTAAEAPAGSQPVVTQPAPNPDERQLTLSFSAVSWVEVRDASNHILFSGNSTPGSRQSLRGRPPFQLVVGNAPTVKLRYEDRNIDLQPYTRVDVARLTLDDNTK